MLKNNEVWLGYTNVKEFCDLMAVLRSLVIWMVYKFGYRKTSRKADLWKKYTPEEYPKYDNYDAINVNKVAEIPCDYDGVMGVPITFMDKYNPDQFEILGSQRWKNQRAIICLYRHSRPLKMTRKH